MLTCLRFFCRCFGFCKNHVKEDLNVFCIFIILFLCVCTTSTFKLDPYLPKLIDETEETHGPRGHRPQVSSSDQSRRLLHQKTRPPRQRVGERRITCTGNIYNIFRSARTSCTTFDCSVPSANKNFFSFFFF